MGKLFSPPVDNFGWSAWHRFLVPCLHGDNRWTFGSVGVFAPIGVISIYGVFAYSGLLPMECNSNGNGIG